MVEFTWNGQARRTLLCVTLLSAFLEMYWLTYGGSMFRNTNYIYCFFSWLWYIYYMYIV